MARRPRREPLTVGAPLPVALEKELLRALRPMVAQVQATLPQVTNERSAKALGVALRRKWPDSKIRDLVAKVGRKVETAGSRAWQPLFNRTDVLDQNGRRRRRVPYDGEALLRQWSLEAAARITSVRDEVAEGLRLDVVAAVEAGTEPEVLAARWRARGVPVEFGTLAGRVKVIAQNQVRVLQAKVQSTRARALGVEEFMWRDQDDGDVRPLHTALGEGGPYSYANPDTQGQGLPGEPINCRCWAESVIPDELVEELNIGAIFER